MLSNIINIIQDDAILQAVQTGQAASIIQSLQACQAGQDAAIAQCSPRIQSHIAMLEGLVKKLADFALESQDTVQHLEGLVASLTDGMTPSAVCEFALLANATANDTQ